MNAECYHTIYVINLEHYIVFKKIEVGLFFFILSIQHECIVLLFFPDSQDLV